MIIRAAILVLLAAAACFAGSTSVRVVHISLTNLNSLPSKQIGVCNVTDDSLGFRMWGGKDTGGVLTKWLAKGQHAKVKNIWEDTARAKAVYSARDTGILAIKDTALIRGLRATRARLDSLRACDTAKITALDVDRFYYGTLSGDRIDVDTVNAKWFSADSCIQLPIRFSDCTADGSIWYQENHGSIHSYIDGVVGTLNRTLFVQSNTVLDSNSTAETSLIGVSANHALDSFPSRYFTIGKSHHFYMSGVYSSKVTGPDSLIIKFSMNATPLCSTTVPLDPNELDQSWTLQGYNVCIDTGATGKFRLTSGFEHTIAGVSHNDRIATPNGGATMNTTIKLLPRITFRFKLADVRNKIKSTQFIIEELH
jgi:hypothetical protein